MNRKKFINFYLLSSTINLCMILLLTISYLTIVESCSPNYFLTNGDSRFILIKSYYLFALWMLFPMTIKIYKNYNNHILIFIIISFSILIINELYQPFSLYEDSNLFKFTLKDYLERLIKGSKKIFIQTTAYVIIVCGFIHFSQMIIGKKLLPTMYKNNKG